MTRWRRFLDWFRPAPVRYPSQAGPVEPFSETGLAALHNLKRINVGSGPLLLDTRLTAYAQARAHRAAVWQLDREHLHDGFDPPAANMTAGENAAIGHADSASAFAGWMASPDHRPKILNPEFTRMGAGRAMSKEGVSYWFCVFAG